MSTTPTTTRGKRGPGRGGSRRRAVRDEARAEFGGFRQEHKGQPSDDLEKALQKWLRHHGITMITASRHHGITMNDGALRAEAAKIATGEAVELADLPSPPG